MKIHLPTLRHYLPDPLATLSDPALRDRLESQGIEVKQIQSGSAGSVATVELLANRGDHHAYWGIAREICAPTPHAAQFPPVHPLSPSSGSPPFQIQTDRCLRYSVFAFRLPDLLPDPLPSQITQALAATDQTVGIPVVDCAHFVGLELGQPLHLFDADRVIGNLTVRLSEPGETAHLLFTAAPQVIPEGTLVIADTQRILAIAGVIGCVGAEITAHTRSILCESALFDPVIIRTQARKLKISTTASMRFERGGDAQMVISAVQRLANWLHIWTAGALEPGTWHVETPHPLPTRTLFIQPAQMIQALGLETTDLDTRGELERTWQQGLTHLGFGISPVADPAPAWEITVPAHRIWDVQTEACIQEECARLMGYMQIPLSYPAVLPTAVIDFPRSDRQIADFLTHQGFDEVIIDSFYGPGIWQGLSEWPGSQAADHVQVINALDKGFSWLKNNGVLPALQLLADNQRHGLCDVRVFEHTRLFYPQPDACDPRLCQERPILWGIATGDPHPHWQPGKKTWDFWALKGIVEGICAIRGMQTVQWGPAEPTQQPASHYLHPHRQATLWYGNQAIGCLGQIHPHLAHAFGLKNKSPWYWELDTSPTAALSPLAPFQDPPEHPPIRRALAFHIPSGIPTAAIQATIAHALPEPLYQIQVVDYFETDTPDPVRAFTFAIWFHNDNNRRAEDINAALETIRNHVLTEWEAQGIRARV